jgi:hypothetical protein
MTPFEQAVMFFYLFVGIPTAAWLIGSGLCWIADLLFNRKEEIPREFDL